MPVNTDYYGAESTWIQFKLNDDYKDFYVASGNRMNDSTYGLAARTWISGLIANDFDNKYYKQIDMSFGWCRTDGTAPFDSCYSVTGYRASGTGMHGRYESNQQGPSTIGLQINGNRISYITAEYVNYYKSSASGSAVNMSSAPHNFRPDYTYLPKIDATNSGDRYVYEAQTGLAPVLKFDFHSVYYVPVVEYALLVDGKTTNDWNAIDDPRNYSALVSNTYRKDLRSFVKYFTDNPTHINRCVIYRIYLMAVACKFDEETGLIIKLSKSSGSATDSSGVIAPLAVPNTTSALTFDDWYSENPDSYNVDIDICFVKNFNRAVNTVSLFDEETNTVITGTFTGGNSIIVSGAAENNYGSGYMAPVAYCYALQPTVIDSGEYTVKRFETLDAGNTYKYAVAVYAFISDFTDLDGFREYCRKCAAYTGAYFSESYYPLWHDTLDDETCFLGTIDAAGVTHGAYTHGSSNLTQQQAQWGDDWSSKTPYNPSPQPKPDHDPNNYINTMPGRNTNYLQGFTRLYAVDGFNMLILRGFLANIPNMGVTLEDHQEYLYKHFLNSNPIDNIVSLKLYPFSLVDYVLNNSPTVEVIKISNADVEYTVGSSTLRAMGTTSGLPATQITLQLGKFTLYTAYGDFRDYEPYSSAKMYLPFCGTASIDIKTILDKELYVAYKVDVKTGSCTAIVTQDSYDGIIVLTAHGTLSVEIPISGIQTADYQNAIFQGITNLKNAQVNQFTAYIQAATGVINAAQSAIATPAAIPTGVSGIAGGIGSAITSDNNLNQAEYNLQSARINHTMIGASSAGDAQLMYMYPSLIVTRPKFLSTYNASAYAHTVGHTCIESDILENFNGYTVVSDIDMSGVEATEAEKNMIKAILASGVYL